MVLKPLPRFLRAFLSTKRLLMKLDIKIIASIVLCFCVTSSAFASDRRKPKKGTSAGNAIVSEPDRPVRHGRPEEAIAPLTDFLLPRKEDKSSGKGHGNINTRYTQGIDVSHYQYAIDWDRVAKNNNISYVYIKATEGNSFVDSYYQRNLEGARKAGISVGCYHFYRPNVDWRQQLAHLKNNVRKEDQDLVPMIDIEVTGRVSTSKLVADLQAFCQAVTDYYGKRPLLYTYRNFYNKHFTGYFREYQWMIAAYTSSEPRLEDGRDYIMWQYSDKGSIDGIRGNVDRSCLMGGFSLEQLRM